MKAKARKSLERVELPSSTSRSRRRNRRSMRKGRPLKSMNETIVLDSDSEDDKANDDNIQVVDIDEDLASEIVGKGVPVPEEIEEGEIVDSTVAEEPEVTSTTTCFNRDDKSLIKAFVSVVSVSDSEKSTLVVTPAPSAPSSEEVKTDSIPVINLGDDESCPNSQNDDDDGIEVVAIVVPSVTKRKSRWSNGERKQNDNVSLMQEAIKRAKNTVRRSSSNSSNKVSLPPFCVRQNNWKGWNSVASTSKQIQRGNKRQNKNLRRKMNRAAQVQNQGWNGKAEYDRNRSRELNREVIFRTNNDNINPFEEITVNVNRNPFAPEFIPFNPVNTSTPVQGTSRNMGMGRGKGATHGPAPIAPGSNIMIVGDAVERPKGSLRPIVIDGSNVAVGYGGMVHGGSKKFSAQGIRIMVDYFLKRGHKEIVVFVPKYRQKRSECLDPELLEEMEREGYVRFTPSREAGGLRIASYDDLFVVQYANETGGIIVSNDNFRDLFETNIHLRETIRSRILMYTWINNKTLMFAPDPLGSRVSLNLDQFLQF